MMVYECPDPHTLSRSADHDWASVSRCSWFGETPDISRQGRVPGVENMNVEVGLSLGMTWPVRALWTHFHGAVPNVCVRYRMGKSANQPLTLWAWIYVRVWAEPTAASTGDTRSDPGKLTCSRILPLRGDMFSFPLVSDQSDSILMHRIMGPLSAISTPDSNTCQLSFSSISV
jgi:hypothetical protein